MDAKKYNVLKDCVIDHSFYQCGTVYTDRHPKGDKTYIDVLIKHGFMKEIIEKPKFGVVATSTLAKVEIADRDFAEGDKKYFTFGEALNIERRLKDTGWRLPTRREWSLICEEFGNNDNDELDATVLCKNLTLGRNGFVDSGRLSSAGSQGWYWSSTAKSGIYAYFLYFDSSSVNPSRNTYRYVGQSVRLVRDVQE